MISHLFPLLIHFPFFNFVKIHSVLREQWIRAKYERTEFIDGAQEPSYLTGTVKG